MSDSRKYHPYPSQGELLDIPERRRGEGRREEERAGKERGGEGAQNAKFVQGNITKT